MLNSEINTIQNDTTKIRTKLMSFGLNAARTKRKAGNQMKAGSKKFFENYLCKVIVGAWVTDDESTVILLKVVSLYPLRPRTVIEYVPALTPRN